MGVKIYVSLIKKFMAIKFLGILILFPWQEKKIERGFYFMTKMQYIVSTKFFNWMNPQNMVKTISHETKAQSPIRVHYGLSKINS